MKYTFLMALAFIGTACAGGKQESVVDYVEVHKIFYSVDCVDSKTQAEMDACGEKGLKSSENRMNALLKSLVASYKSSEPGLVEVLNASQKQWRHYAEAGCKVDTWYSREGSAFQSIWNACLEAKINERVSYLTWLSDNP